MKRIGRPAASHASENHRSSPDGDSAALVFERLRSFTAGSRIGLASRIRCRIRSLAASVSVGVVRVPLATADRYAATTFATTSARFIGLDVRIRRDARSFSSGVCGRPGLPRRRSEHAGFGRPFNEADTRAATSARFIGLRSPRLDSAIKALVCGVACPRTTEAPRLFTRKPHPHAHSGGVHFLAIQHVRAYSFAHFVSGRPQPQMQNLGTCVDALGIRPTMLRIERVLARRLDDSAGRLDAHDVLVCVAHRRSANLSPPNGAGALVEREHFMAQHDASDRHRAHATNDDLSAISQARRTSVGAAVAKIPFHGHRGGFLAALPADEAVEVREGLLAGVDVGHGSHQGRAVAIA